jgi:hypothetical protein
MLLPDAEREVQRSTQEGDGNIVKGCGGSQPGDQFLVGK